MTIKGWYENSIEDLCNIDFGTRVVQKRDGGSKFPVYGGGGATFFVDEFNRENSVIISRFAMSKQCTRYVRGRFFLNDSGLSVSTKDNNILLQSFLDKHIYFLNNTIYELGKGAAQRNLDTSRFKSLIIKYPKSIVEQQRIVELLDVAIGKSEQLKANAENNLHNTRKLFESTLENEFVPQKAWKRTTLEEVCEISSKLIDPKKESYQDLLHVGAGNIVAQKGTLIDVKTAKEEGLISGKFIFDESMVLYSKIRPYLMKVIRCNFNGLCSADIYPLSPKVLITRDFLYYLLLTKKFTDYAILGSQRAGMPKVNREHLFAYEFSIPPINDQKKITEALDSISMNITVLEQKFKNTIFLCTELKESVLAEAFHGKL